MLCFKKAISVFSLCLILVSCAHKEVRETSEIEEFLGNVENKVKPIWNQDVSASVQKLKSRGLTSKQLQAPEYQVDVAVEIAKNGQVKKIEVLSRPKYAFLSKAAQDAFKRASPLPKPPESCVVEEICRIRSNFVIEK